MSIALRILDANANRTREALRVMEEAARFILDDASLVTAIKQLRHDFAHAVASCKACQTMAAWRDTLGDVGTTISTEAEQTRTSLASVSIAAGKRLSESLRAMEEYAKTLGTEGSTLARHLEALRYRGYQVEQQLNLAMAGCRVHDSTAPSDGSPDTDNFAKNDSTSMAPRVKQWRLCVLISESLCPESNWLGIANATLQGGADCLQLREKNLDAHELLARARTLVKTARPFGASVIINDRPDIAMLAGAHGVHLGQHDLAAVEVRKLFGNELVIGVSTSTLEEATAALRSGADYCGVGPMFPTTTKHKDVIVGPAYLKQFLNWNRCPHLAIGGISTSNLPTLVQAGVKGIAVSSAVCAASDPVQATRDLLQILP